MASTLDELGPGRIPANRVFVKIGLYKSQRTRVSHGLAPVVNA